MWVRLALALFWPRIFFFITKESQSTFRIIWKPFLVIYITALVVRLRKWNLTFDSLELVRLKRLIWNSRRRWLWLALISRRNSCCSCTRRVISCVLFRKLNDWALKIFVHVFTVFQPHLGSLLLLGRWSVMRATSTLDLESAFTVWIAIWRQSWTMTMITALPTRH